MSNSTPAQHNPSPTTTLTPLTGAAAAIYTELLRLTEEVTASQLALAAKVGRSTAGKALTKLEQQGLAVRTPGEFDGPGRTPDLWRATAPAHATSSFYDKHGLDAGQPESPIGNAPEPVGTITGDESLRTTEPSTDAPTAPDEGSTDPITVPVPIAPQNTKQGADHQDDKGRPQNEDSNARTADDHATAPEENLESHGTPQVINLPGQKIRLAPGALRQMVAEHLQAHPNEEFTATKISRAIEKSSGAIANALVILARHNIAEQVSDQPRMYRLATPENKG